MKTITYSSLVQALQEICSQLDCFSLRSADVGDKMDDKTLFYCRKFQKSTEYLLLKSLPTVVHSNKSSPQPIKVVYNSCHVNPSSTDILRMYAE